MFTECFKVLDVYPGLHKRGKGDYIRVDALVCGMEMIVYMPGDIDVERGSCWHSSSLALTNDVVNDGKCLALIAMKCEHMDWSEFNPYKKGLTVKCNGKLVKTEKAYIRKVGAKQNEFLPCTLAVQKEDGTFFNTFLVCFNEMATAVNELQSGTYINVVARVKQRRGNSDFELNLSSFTIVNKPTAKKKAVKKVNKKGDKKA